MVGLLRPTKGGFLVEGKQVERRSAETIYWDSGALIASTLSLKPKATPFYKNLQKKREHRFTNWKSLL
jgi:hypothetical protein